MDTKLKTGTCFFGHKWTKWEQENIDIQIIRNGRAYDGVDTIQKRRCVRCGKMEVEDVKTN